MKSHKCMQLWHLGKFFPLRWDEVQTGDVLVASAYPSTTAAPLPRKKGAGPSSLSDLKPTEEN